MCGLVGIAGSIGVKGEKAFKRMLELDTVRGPHSTGVLSVTIQKECKVVKQLGTPWDLYDYKPFNEMINRSHNVLMGHNRWATKGRINKANAHPFEFENLVGAHNGTLNSVYNLDDYKDFEVDSENIYHHMNKHGVYNTIPKLNGAFALTWFDKTDNTLNFIRNKERELFYAFTKDKETLFWASEPWMIIVSAASQGYDLDPIQLLPEGVLHTFDVKFGYPVKPFEKVRVRKLDLFQSATRLSVTSSVSTSKTSHSNNVTPISKATVPVKAKKSFAEHQKYIGKRVSFYAGKEAISESQQPYIECWLEDDDDICVRVFATKDSVLWNEMLDSVGFFVAEIRAYNSLSGGYLTIDMRTIEEVVTGVDVVEEDIVVHDGEVVTPAIYKIRTAKGCAWCSDPVLIDDHADLHWVSKHEFLCPDCKQQPEVKKYLVGE